MKPKLDGPWEQWLTDPPRYTAAANGIVAWVRKEGRELPWSFEVYNMKDTLAQGEAATLAAAKRMCEAVLLQPRRAK